MNDTLRERVAEALWNYECSKQPGIFPPWSRAHAEIKPGRLAQADAVLSVLHKAGEQGERQAVNLSARLSEMLDERDREVLRVIQDDNGYAVILPGDGEWARSEDPSLLENYVAQVLHEARTFRFTDPSPAVAGEQDGGDDVA